MLSRRCFPLFSLVVLLFMVGCRGHLGTFTLRGDITSLGDDTVYVCSTSGYFDRLEPVRVRHGRFRFSFRPDTITPLWVFFPGGHYEYLFAEKSTETLIAGDSALAGHLTVSGGTQNDLLADFEAMLRDTVLTEAEVAHLADTFIMHHPFDDASVWLLQKYFADVPAPDASAIRSAIGRMSGNLQDNSYVGQLRTRLTGYKPKNVSNVVSNYNVCDTTGRRVTTTQFGDSCVLITFWASWDEESREQQREYRALTDSFAGRPFTILSVSLDTRREDWMRAIYEDSLQATHADNFTGWDLELIRSLGINNLPFNALLSPQRRIQASNLYGEELVARIDKLLTEEQIRQQQLEKAEKERQKNLKKKK